ncbi:hypothetical protein K466DRAFT_603198 [Polyporus arcularius HHB13444]|uniref:DUF7025 domain-containing protein n=1 Tax=Polyporus arcularius HHB13444 TaxID=1314778 RepID=A0A5C3P1Z2_9APHY|nr:hypothetical protein K466DRAFT_603198 [Polyporus arcularius HHB13444]
MSSSPHTLAASGGTPTASPATEVLSTYFVPGATVIQPCKITGHQRAYRVLSSPHRVKDEADKDNAALASYSLSVECLGLIPQEPVAADNRRAVPEYRIGRVQTSLSFQVDISGVRDIRSLSVYPIEHHPSGTALKFALIARGKVWADVSRRGLQLSQFTGQEVRLTLTFPSEDRTSKDTPKKDPATLKKDTTPIVGWKRSRVDSSIILLDHGKLHGALAKIWTDVSVDTGGHFAMNPQSQVFLYEYLKANEQTSGQENESRDDWLLAPTVVYGYNVPERRWAAFDINGDFQYYPQDLVVLTGDQCHPPRLTGVDISDYGMTRTHAWINGISRKAIGQDGQGLLLIILKGEDRKCIVILVLPNWTQCPNQLKQELYSDSNFSVHCVWVD